MNASTVLVLVARTAQDGAGCSNMISLLRIHNLHNINTELIVCILPNLSVSVVMLLCPAVALRLTDNINDAAYSAMVGLPLLVCFVLFILLYCKYKK